MEDDDSRADEVILERSADPGAITVQELVNRCRAQAMKFGVNSNTRLLLLNVCNALVELTVRLDAAEKLLGRDDAPPPKPKSNLIILPSSEN